MFLNYEWLSGRGGVIRVDDRSRELGKGVCVESKAMLDTVGDVLKPVLEAKTMQGCL